ncbi:stomatal closure-related actin-binding protein 2 [Forsythia ovata]|uniref:Stomatal closure-related actin-binding protein 2 n=1 Tax=Forsythia ovata TaxID=205694 RepID=A0ABD1P380_9LAMI
MSADVSFASNQFPKYKLGPDNEILDEVKEDIQCPSLKEVVVEETHQLTEQHKQLSVRDLACKFSKNLSAAPKLSEAVVGSWSVLTPTRVKGLQEVQISIAYNQDWKVLD